MQFDWHNSVWTIEVSLSGMTPAELKLATGNYNEAEKAFKEHSDALRETMLDTWGAKQSFDNRTMILKSIKTIEDEKRRIKVYKCFGGYVRLQGWYDAPKR